MWRLYSFSIPATSDGEGQSPSHSQHDHPDLGILENLFPPCQLFDCDDAKVRCPKSANQPDACSNFSAFLLEQGDASARIEPIWANRPFLPG